MATGENSKGTAELARVQKRNAMIDNIDLIPSFSGDSGAIPLSEFFEKFDSLAEMLEWEDTEKLFALKFKVTGTAARLVRDSKGKSFNELVQLLKTRFVQVDTPDVALAKFLNFKQPVNMRVQEFYDRAASLAMGALQIEGMEAQVVKSSRQALLHNMLLTNLTPSVRKGVITKNPKDPLEILEFALLEEKACMSVNPFHNMEFNQDISYLPTQNAQKDVNIACAAPQRENNQTEIEINRLNEKIDMLAAKFESMLNAQSHQPVQRPYRNMEPVICYQCNYEGHYARDCPQRQQQYEHPSYRGKRGNWDRQRGNGSFRGRNDRERGKFPDKNDQKPKEKRRDLN